MAGSMMDVKNFFNDPRKPLSTNEFQQFWKSLSDSEKDYYKSAVA